jgi:hypothetical protein
MCCIDEKYSTATMDAVGAIGQAEVELVLRKAVKKEVHVLSYKFQPFDTKVGFMGDHRTIIVNYQEINSSDNSQKEISFFVKLVPEGERYRKFILDRGLFAKEQEMYQKLLPMMSKALQKEMPVAECYLIEEDRYVVFEDLLRLGYKLADR